MTNKVDGLNAESPIDISKITEYLYIGAHPRSGAVEYVGQLGIRLVISMLAIRPTQAFTQRPFKAVMLPSFDHPRIPIPVFVLRRGVRAALPVIEAGDAVMTYCKEGRHRSVAMACCILISQGYSVEDAMQLVREKREVADPQAPHIERQIRRFAESWASNPL